MKKLSTLIASFALLGTLASCGSGNSTTSGTSANAGTVVTGVSNECTTQFKSYINNAAGKLQASFPTRPTYLNIDYKVAQGQVDWLGFYERESVDKSKQVASGANKAELLRIANSSSSCQYNGRYFQLKEGNIQYIIDAYSVAEANPVRTINQLSEYEYEIYTVKKWYPEGYTSYTMGDLWDKIKDIF